MQTGCPQSAQPAQTSPAGSGTAASHPRPAHGRMRFVSTRGEKLHSMLKRCLQAAGQSNAQSKNSACAMHTRTHTHTTHLWSAGHPTCGCVAGDGHGAQQELDEYLAR
eukprot:scaffold180815_cov22-Tisochrysis_lutea.AAC.2